MSEPSSHNQSRSRRPRPGRLGVGIVSAGRVGAVLGSALRAVDHRVVGVHAVSEASRERAEMLLPAVPVLDVEEIVRRAELVVLAVPDDGAPVLARELTEVCRLVAAGARESDLHPLAETVITAGVLGQARRLCS